MTILPETKALLQGLEWKPFEWLEIEKLLTIMQAEVRQVIQRIFEELLEEEVNCYLDRPWYGRRKKSKHKKINLYCSRCRSHDRQKFRRNGHYRRRLNTQWGVILLHVPQLECACGGNVKVKYRVLRCRQRMWDDFDFEVRVDYGRGLSYRLIKMDWDERLQGSVGLRTINQRVLAGAESAPNRPLKKEEVPPVVRMDGIWITVMYPTGEYRRDRMGRNRPVKKAKKVPILAAQGAWPETGRTVLLSWRLAEGEDTESWQAFMEQLWEMGVSKENGLALLVADGSQGFRAAYENRYWMVPFQRCVFHKLRNIAKKVRTSTTLGRQEAFEYRIRLVRQAARIWQAEDETEARSLFKAFCEQWRSTQSKAVATLERDFEDTLTFFDVQSAALQQNLHWPARFLRTTSPLERMFRNFRQRFRSATLFHSPEGALAATAQLAYRFS